MNKSNDKEAILYLQRKGKVQKGDWKTILLTQKEKDEIAKYQKVGQLYGDPLIVLG